MPRAIKTKRKKEAPCPAQVLRVLSGQPTALEATLGRMSTRPARSYAQAARILGCSAHKVKKMMNDILELPAGAELETVREDKGAGRPEKDAGISLECLQDVAGRPTLRRQCGMTLTERAMEANERFGSTMAASDLRKLYRQQQITK